MNEVFSKLQDWLNRRISGEQIAQYCAEMGFHFYPGCTLPSFPNFSQDDEGDGNATPDATGREASGANPYRKAFGDATRPKTFGDATRAKTYGDAMRAKTGKDFDNEDRDDMGDQDGQESHENSQGFCDSSSRRMGFPSRPVGSM
jgi:hypothetical protein